MIEAIHVSRLSMPLKMPYKLALGDVRHFDMLLVQVIADGRLGIGEATILNGYTEETIEGSWELANALMPDLRGHPVEAAYEALGGTLREVAPFTVTAFCTAIETAIGEPLLDFGARASVPLVSGINATEHEPIECEIEAAIAAGYRTLKIKVGFGVESDLARIAFIQAINRGRATLRIDANQGYSREDACAFARQVSPESVELFEQPCHAKDWDGARAVAQAGPVPLMLDESIYSIKDIERAARAGAGFVKLKLMKCGSLRDLVRGLNRIRELGLQPVLGNGVAGDIGCWMEACIAATMVDNAGEMNGYLRQRETIVAESVPVVAGAMRLEPGFIPQLSEERLRRLMTDQAGDAVEARETAL